MLSCCWMGIRPQETCYKLNLRGNPMWIQPNWSFARKVYLPCGVSLTSSFSRKVARETKAKSVCNLECYLDESASAVGWAEGKGGSWNISGSDCTGRGRVSVGTGAAPSTEPPALCWPSTAPPMTWYFSSFDMSFFDERFELATAFSVLCRLFTCSQILSHYTCTYLVTNISHLNSHTRNEWYPISYGDMTFLFTRAVAWQAMQELV